MLKAVAYLSYAWVVQLHRRQRETRGIFRELDRQLDREFNDLANIEFVLDIGAHSNTFKQLATMTMTIDARSGRRGF